MVDPLTIYGFKALWNIITHATQLSVCRQANDFFQELYANLKEGVELAKPILDFLLEELKKQDAKVLRVLLVLEDVIDLSEVNG